MINCHNEHHYAVENPHCVKETHVQRRFHFNVWMRIVDDTIIGPYFFPEIVNVTAEVYSAFLEETLPGLLEDVPLHIRPNIIFQQDGHPAHTSVLARTILNRRFTKKWIGIHSDLHEWPPRSPDLRPLDFFAWGFIRDQEQQSPAYLPGISGFAPLDKNFEKTSLSNDESEYSECGSSSDNLQDDVEHFAVMATIGKLSEFNAGNEIWSSYIERFEFFTEANRITTDSGKRCTLLTAVGAKTYETIKNLIAPETPSSHEFVFKNVIKNRARICWSSSAKFGGTEEKLPLDMMLRDRFVAGIRDEELQRYLCRRHEKTLTKDNKVGLTLSKALEIRSSIEGTELLQKMLKNPMRSQIDWDTDSSDGTTIYSIHGKKKIHSTSSKYRTKLKLNSVKIEMEIDNGADKSLINRSSFELICANKNPAWSSRLPNLKAWGKRPIKTLGIAMVDEAARYEELLGKYPGVLQKDLSRHSGTLINIELKAEHIPKFFKARRVPYGLIEPVNKALAEMVEQGMLTPVNQSDWATPALFVRKPNGTIRVVGDYKVTVNPYIRESEYQIPTVEEAMTSLNGGKIFSQIDLKNAYKQLRVDEKTAKIFTISTPHRLFNVIVLVDGLNIAPRIFQKFMVSRLQGISGILIYLDNIKIQGRNKEEHDIRLEKVLERLNEANLRINRKKCTFGVCSMEFLGYQISEKGIQPLKAKLDAITKMPEPGCVRDLQVFLGGINFYGRCIKDRAKIAEPLHRLPDSTAEWEWTEIHKKAIQE
ncbi:uncharacterized protein LOC112457238 [Temnothorax curvispinosus]|uniref:Uncharacterized protein LOC112457238 n=1 Tax=Temnothorax curvispinosus TaxID=300111 RepID=A0A6J1Q2Q6_9HYME|nr:uncharacterized protein LOC112457238 [Temnothorax curvispinosus]